MNGHNVNTFFSLPGPGALFALCRFIACLVVVSGVLCPAAFSSPPPADGPDDAFKTRMTALGRFAHRVTGSTAAQEAKEYILNYFKSLDMGTVGVHEFQVPVKKSQGARLVIPDIGLSLPLFPLDANLLSPETTPPEGLKGRFIYVKKGRLADFNDKTVKGAIVFMDLDSGKNWINAANLGAAAVVYVKNGPVVRSHYQHLFELTPISLPRFMMPGRDFSRLVQADPASQVLVKSKVDWELTAAQNVYLLIPGADPELKKHLVIVESFYDTASHVLDIAPGADESVSMATLMESAAYFKTHPPARSVLLLATSGHAQALAGLRALVWAVSTKGKILKRLKNQISEEKDAADGRVALLEDYLKTKAPQLLARPSLVSAVGETIKNRVDRLSRELIRMRLIHGAGEKEEKMRNLVQERGMFRRLGWKTDFSRLTPDEAAAFAPIPARAAKEQKRLYKAAKARYAMIKSDRAFRKQVGDFKIDAAVSLHLSSHGSGVGGFSKGWLYPLKPEVNRISPYAAVNDLLIDGANSLPEGHFFVETLKPGLLKSHLAYFLDQPALGGEVFALAGMPGFTLATVNDGRFFWGTPDDTLDRVDMSFAAAQSRLVCHLVSRLSDTKKKYTEKNLRKGFSHIEGRARFLRQGELFADQPASGAVIAAYQGTSVFHAMSDAAGSFFIKGVADKKHVLDKVILEGLVFDPDTGAAAAAIDKDLTGKSAYRIKIQRRNMECDLVMFACAQSSLFHMTEVRNFNFLTKIKLLSAKTESEPLRYWYSRLDTRRSDLLSLFLEPGARFKLTLSDTVLENKLVLTHGTADTPIGTGYRVDDYPRLIHTPYRVAKDMWTLLEPRISLLERHGIFSAKIRSLAKEGKADLQHAERALTQKKYDRFSRFAADSWALAQRVYQHVEKTKKDVLFGVLFYIALFVPFSFCMERLIFGYTNIHRRIVAFLGILGLLILLIYNIHPAFRLAYSPGVVILAFFIMGLSMMVTLIIFFRFEREMTRLQRRAQHMKVGEISKGKAFIAAFFLGVGNLRRRKLRTGLTCATLVILTFTVMSFTTVTSILGTNRIKFQDKAPYPGVLLKKPNWETLAAAALSTLSMEFSDKARVVPRIWLENQGAIEARVIPISRKGHVFEARGAVGLSPDEIRVTPVGKSLVEGKWFRRPDAFEVILSQSAARRLDIGPLGSSPVFVDIFGEPFRVAAVFNERAYDEARDLDNEPLTPVLFPMEAKEHITEAEQEAIESGEDVLSAQTRYVHLPASVTIILPADTLAFFGGVLKGVAMHTKPSVPVKSLAAQLVDRFALQLFAGETDGGTFVYEISDSLRFSGVPNIAVPIVISVLIVLNTMISSVYERKKEIAIYTSMGLAPSHVGFLFVAEALALSIISVILGYLAAQTSARFLSETAIWSGITVNYSSLAGVASMVLVMAVVLVSVIYPAKVASRIAIPDVNRSWKMPVPKGDFMDLTLPFLMKYAEFQSIGLFLRDHFVSHEDVSHGLFSTEDIQFSHLPAEAVNGDEPAFTASHVPDELAENNACLWLSAMVWLAPFDFGIMQKTDLYFCPAQSEPGFLEIRIKIQRLAGEANMWKRINKAFLHDVRKQILVWRSLEDGVKEAA